MRAKFIFRRAVLACVKWWATSHFSPGAVLFFSSGNLGVQREVEQSLQCERPEGLGCWDRYRLSNWSVNPNKYVKKSSWDTMSARAVKGLWVPSAYAGNRPSRNRKSKCRALRNLRSIPKRKFAQNLFDNTRKGCSPQKKGSVLLFFNIDITYSGMCWGQFLFSTVWNTGNVYTCDFNFLDVAHSIFLLYSKTSYQPRNWPTHTNSFI